MFRALVFVIALATAGALTAQARGSTALVGPSTEFGTQAFLYVASPGESNDVTITDSWPTVTIRDAGAVIIPGSGCVAVDPHEVTCDWSSTTNDDLEVLLDDQDDRLVLDEVGFNGAAFFGGAGNDRILGGPSGAEYLHGGDGDDVLKGRDEFDILDGGAGADVLSGGQSWFNMGGESFPTEDVVTYETSLANVRADADGLADDGAVGEGDNILANVEKIVGGHGNDVLRSAGGGHVLDGREGNDILQGWDGWDALTGGPGDDTLIGRHGNDWLYGDEGNDTLRGGGGNDRLSGREGNDRLVGGLGADFMGAGDGADLLLARDGKVDRVLGRSGIDRARIDAHLDIVRGVERFLR
jgi:Ca2+-binding RTX toxin-like protein